MLRCTNMQKRIKTFVLSSCPASKAGNRLQYQPRAGKYVPSRRITSSVWSGRFCICDLRGLTQHKIWNKFHICKPQTHAIKTAFYESHKKTAKKQQTYIRQVFCITRLVDNLVDNLVDRMTEINSRKNLDLVFPLIEWRTPYSKHEKGSSEGKLPSSCRSNNLSNTVSLGCSRLAC